MICAQLMPPIFSPPTSLKSSARLSYLLLPPDTEVKAEWIYVQGELEGTENYLIDDYSLTAEGTLYLSFSLTEPDAGWPKGEYKVILYVDGKEKLSVPFTVQ